MPRRKASFTAIEKSVRHRQFQSRMASSPGEMHLLEAKKVARQLRILRLEAGLTQAKLAQNAGVTVETVARIERAVRGSPSAMFNPTLETLVRLCFAMGVRVTALFEGRR